MARHCTTCASPCAVCAACCGRSAESPASRSWSMPPPRSGGSAGRSATWRCCCRRSPPKGCGMRWRCAGRCWSPATWRFSPASRCTACSFAWTSGRPCCVRPSGMPCWMACTAGCASACAGNGRPCAPSWRTPPMSTGTRYGYGSSACATGWRPIRTIAAFPARCWRRSRRPSRRWAIGTTSNSGCCDASASDLAPVREVWTARFELARERAGRALSTLQQALAEH